MAYNFRHFCICIYIYLTLVVAEVVNDEKTPLNISRRSTPDLKNNLERHEVCLSTDCIDTALDILNNMNSDVQPCDDFYKFACDGYLHNATIPDGDQLVSPDTTIKFIVIEKLRTIIERNSPSKEPRPYRLVKDFYKSCVSGVIKEIKNYQPSLLATLDYLQKIGPWPVLERKKWHEYNFNLTDFVHKFRKFHYPLDYFIAPSIFLDHTESRIHLAPRFIQFPLEGFKDIQELHTHMVHTAEILGANRKRASVQLRRALDFGMKIVNLTWTDKLNYLIYKDIQLHQLSTDFPSIPWLEYLNAVLPRHIRLNQNSTIKIPYLYLRDLEALISETPKKVQANYILWWAISKWATSGIINEILQLNKERELKREECFNLTCDHLDLGVGSMYFNEYGGKDVLQIINDIKNEIKKILRKAEWMDEKTRAKALEKVESMKSHVIYPDEFLDMRELNKFYKELELNATDFLGNKLNLTIFEENNTANKTVWWRMHVKLTKAIAFYIPDYNSIVISTAYMQGIFFNNNRPPYMNYGALGSIIGHEMVHSFDYIGGKYNNTGEKVDWWEPETKDNFAKRSQCLIHQYGQYGHRDTSYRQWGDVNGIQTLHENVADNMGLKVAYYAYKEWIKSYGREQKLPALHYTPEQMFWISFANTWCTKYAPGYVLRLMKEKHHSPAKDRVNGPLSNLKEFSRDFNCKIGSKMNPVKKCDIW